MPALFNGVMQRAISAGSERVAGQLSTGKDNTEQRGEGKQSQKHLFRQLGLFYTDEERRLRATTDQIGLIRHLEPCWLDKCLITLHGSFCVTRNFSSFINNHQYSTTFFPLCPVM